MQSMRMEMAAGVAMITVVNITMRSMNITMRMEIAAGAVMNMVTNIVMKSMSITIRMEMAAGAVMITVMNIAMKIMNITMRMELAAGAAMFMSTKNMRGMPTATMYRAIPRIVTVSCATPTRNTATCAARAWINVPVRCLTRIW